jgi:hypothetical protein
MFNSTLPNVESEVSDRLNNGYVNLLDRRDRWSTPVRVNPLKGLFAGVSNCSVAHWYLMPGLNFHRYRVRLTLSTILGKRRELRNVVAQALDETISPTAFLDFDFAWKALASREFFGTYLDYSSPWLFPAMVLKERRLEGAMVLGSDPLGMEVIERLSREQRDGRNWTICKRINGGAFTNESFDVVTSLSWIARVEDDIGTLKQLWGAVKPGGMLLLSLPCTTRMDDGRPRNKTFSTVVQKPEKWTSRLYNESMLRERVFAVVGQPRRYVVYGESKPGIDRNLTTPAGNRDSHSFNNFVAIARGWQTYSSLGDIPGEGVIAMKFIKREVR